MSSPRRERPTALLIDLDGVLRRWDPAVPAGIEKRHGLEPGAIESAAFEPQLLRAAVTGRITHDEWMARVAELLEAPAAVREWAADHGYVDADVLGFVRRVRATGRCVGLATNATDRLDADLSALGLTGEVDAVVNSSRLGVAKPSAEYFDQACAALRVPPRLCLLLDDSERAVRGARAAGLVAHRWTGPDDLRYLAAALEP